MLYHWKTRLLKTKRGSYAARWLRGQIRFRLGRGPEVGSYDRLPEYIKATAPGKSFVDVGCMWGVNGAYAFLAEDSRAAAVKGVDVFGPTPEFEAEHRARQSSVEFIVGDATDPDIIERVGATDVVLCAGVLYHHPSPFDLLVALRRMCQERLILRTTTIPEVPGFRNMAIYWPQLAPEQRERWRLPGLDRQVGITDPFDPEEGYGNWFWGMTPSCVSSLLETAGFRVTYRAWEPFAQTFICSAVRPALEHRLPSRDTARRMGEAVSASGEARPH